MIPSELDEIQCASGICVPKEFQPIACMAFQKFFDIFVVIVTIQCIIIWAFTNELCHLKAQRISFRLVYLTA